MAKVRIERDTFGDIEVPAERLHSVVAAGEQAGVACRIVRRTTEPSPALVEVPAE